MTLRPPGTDFNPATRDPSSFGYSPVRDALHNVSRFLGMAAPLPYPRAIDSSHWTIANVKDWKQVAASIALFYTKSTEGVSYQDVDSQQGALAAKAAGLITLFFAFFRRHLNGTAQFTYFQAKTEPLITQIGGAKIVIIDMETSDGVGNVTGNNNFKLFATAAQAAGYKVGLYINPASWSAFGLGAWVNLYVDFYILAAWKPGNAPGLPNGMAAAKLAMQQEGVLGLHSWVAPIPGLEPQMDANLLLWPLAQWETFTGQKYSPGVQPPDPVPPIGETPVKFKVKGEMNYRSSPAVITSPSNDIGDFEGGETITAIQVLAVTAARVWVQFSQAPDKWAALVYDGKIYLDPA